jgi:hypothetical protein
VIWELGGDLVDCWGVEGYRGGITQRTSIIVRSPKYGKYGEEKEAAMELAGGRHCSFGKCGAQLICIHLIAQISEQWLNLSRS